jgi:hypothetical protein
MALVIHGSNKYIQLVRADRAVVRLNLTSFQGGEYCGQRGYQGGLPGLQRLVGTARSRAAPPWPQLHSPTDVLAQRCQRLVCQVPPTGRHMYCTVLYLRRVCP